MGTIEPRTVKTRSGLTVLLRSFAPEDAPALAELDGAAVREGGDGELRDEPPSVEDRAKRIAEHLESPVRIMIGAFDGGSGALVGRLSFHAEKWRKVAHHGMFGIGVAEGLRGKGIGMELILALLDWAAAHPTIERVALGCFSTNQSAMRLYSRLGFVEHAREPQYFRLGDRRYADDVRMSIWVKPGLAPPGFRTYSPKQR